MRKNLSLQIAITVGTGCLLFAATVFGAASLLNAPLATAASSFWPFGLALGVFGAGFAFYFTRATEDDPYSLDHVPFGTRVRHRIAEIIGVVIGVAVVVAIAVELNLGVVLTFIALPAGIAFGLVGGTLVGRRHVYCYDCGWRGGGNDLREAACPSCRGGKFLVIGSYIVDISGNTKKVRDISAITTGLHIAALAPTCPDSELAKRIADS